MKLSLRAKFHEIRVDRSITPLWADKIKRWSQLDDASWVVAQAASISKDFLTPVEQTILLSSQASNDADSHFAQASKISPSAFVHTLPNVRYLALASVTGHAGRMWCLSQGSASLVTFLREACLAHAGVTTLVVNVNRRPDHFECDFYQLAALLDGADFLLELRKDSRPGALVDDETLRRLLLSRSPAELSPGLMLRNNDVS